MSVVAARSDPRVFVTAPCLHVRCASTAGRFQPNVASARFRMYVAVVPWTHLIIVRFDEPAISIPQLHSLIIVKKIRLPEHIQAIQRSWSRKQTSKDLSLSELQHTCQPNLPNMITVHLSHPSQLCHPIPGGHPLRLMQLGYTFPTCKP